MSSNIDVQPIREVLRTSVAIGGDPFTGLTWGFEGRTEEFFPATDTVHRPATRMLTGPVNFGTLGQFQAEIAALRMDPTLAAILPAGAIPPLPNLGDITDQVLIAGDFSGARMSWATPAAGAPNATLHIDFTLAIQPDPIEPLDALFDISRYSTPVDVDIGAEPCGTCPNVNCNDAPGRTAAA